MIDQVQVSALERSDVGEMDGLFRSHTGRPLDRDLITSWIEAWPSAGARVESRLIGYAVGASFAPDIVEFAALLVAPGHRRSGVGTALTSAFEAGCEDRGFSAVIAVTSQGRQVVEAKPSSWPFFERLGYQSIFQTGHSTVMARTLAEAR